MIRLDLFQDGQPAAPLTVEHVRPKAKRRRWPVWLLAGLAITALAGWAAREAITAKVESALLERLTERGINLRYARRSWSPWSGLRLEEVVLHRAAEGDHPVVAVSAVAADFSWWGSLTSRALVSRWRTKDATLKLYDDAGIVTFERVTTEVVTQPGRIEIPRLESRHGGLAAFLTGKILVARESKQPPTKAEEFALDLSILRTVLAVLEFQAEKEPFAIRGSYLLDFREPAVAWEADLAGAGQAVVWQSVPLREARVKAQLSAAGMKLTSDLQFNQGSARVSVSRTNWDDSPLLIAGSLTAAGGQADDFAASYQSATQTVVISTLSGPANLLEFARNFPVLASYLPASLQIQPFPDIAVQDFAWSFSKTDPAWSMGAIQSRSPTDVTITSEGTPLRIAALEGHAAFAEKTWKVRLKSGHLAWRDLDVRGVEIDATVASARVKSNVSLQLTKGSATLAVSTEDWSRAPWPFTGSLTDSHGQADRFAGSYDHEPTALRLTRLDGRANLLELAANFPGLAERFPKTLQVRTFPEIAVKDFLYRPGKTPTFGALRLVTPAAVSVSLRGHSLPINQLTGLIAYDGKTWQLSRLTGQTLGGQFSVDGNYDGGTLRRASIAFTRLQLDQLAPWLGQAQASLGAGVLTLDYRGSIGSEPAQLAGSGSIQLENAPLVKVPLLDQTYALFSSLVSPVKRSGTGRLSATFSANKGVAAISQFTATSDAVKVTANGTLDLVRRQVSARARGNLRGLVGVATSPLSHTLEMQVSGPLDNIRVRPTGLGGIVTRSLSGTAAIVPGTVKATTKLTGSVVRDGVALPLKALKLFKPEPAPAK